jgi:hypothetical protein
LDANGNQVPEAASVLPPGDPGSQQQVYETQSSHEYFVKEEDGKVVEEVSDGQGTDSSICHYNADTESLQPVNVISNMFLFLMRSNNDLFSFILQP